MIDIEFILFTGVVTIAIFLSVRIVFYLAFEDEEKN